MNSQRLYGRRAWDETKTNTMVTVIVTAIIAAILWVFDQVFGWLTDRMLG